MSIRNTIARLSVATLLLGALGPPALAGSAVKVAQKALKDKVEQAEDDLKDCYKTADKDFKQALATIEKAVKDAEFTALQAVEEANAAAAYHAMHLDQHASYVMYDVCGFASSLLTGLGKAPEGFVIGDCGTFDKFLKFVDGQHGKQAEKASKRLKKLLEFLKKVVAKGGKVKIDIKVKISIVLPPPPAPGPVPAPPPPLRFKSVSSAHDSKQANDGKMSVRGQGPANGVVTVNIRGPGGVNITKNVPTDKDGCFKVGFPSAPGDGNPGNLPEGNYKVTLTSGGQTASQFHGV